MKALPSLEEIRRAHGWKADYERWLPLSRYIFRPLGFVITWAAVRVGLTSEAVSWLSAAVGLAGLACLMLGPVTSAWTGLGLLLLFNLLDCVDGSIARSVGTGNPYGRFLDAICGFTVDVAFWAGVGVMVFRHPEFAGSFGRLSPDPVVWLAVGGAACFGSVLLHEVERAYEQLLHPSWCSPGEPAREPWLKTMARNLRVRETQYVLLGLAMAGRAVSLLLAGYLLYYALHIPVAVRVYAARGHVIRRASLSPPR